MVRQDIPNRADKRSENGAILVITAIFAVVILAFFAIAVGLTFVSTQDQRMITVGNVGALAALDYYISNPTDATVSEDERRNDAVDRANFILSQNKLSGAQFALGGVGTGGAGSGGRLRFGSYFRVDPGATASPNCSSPPAVFPCFEEIASPEGGNAVLLELQNEQSNPLVAPFTKLLGKDEFFLSTSSVTTLANTCVAHLLDVSFSVVSGTHTPFPAGGGVCQSALPAANCCSVSDGFVPCAVRSPHPDGITFTPEPDISGGCSAPLIKSPTVPQTVSVGGFGEVQRFSSANAFAFNARKIFADPTVASPTTFSGCELMNSAYRPDITYWVNLPDSRRQYESIYGPAPQEMLFKSDYVLRRVHGGVPVPPVDAPPDYMLVNMNPALRPSPLREFLLAANISLRMLGQLPAEANRGLFMAFTGTHLNRRFPQSGGLTSDLSFLTQLTNMDLIGNISSAATPDFQNGAGVVDGSSQTFPNMLDYGFFPSQATPPNPADSNELVGANIVRALFETAQLDFGNPVNGCSNESRRQIFLYTDMIPTCRYIPNAPAAGFGPSIPASCSLSSDPDAGGLPTAMGNYRISEYVILNQLIPYLQSQGITVSVFLDGPNVAPNFRNVINPELEGAEKAACENGTDRDPGCFVSFAEAYAAGYEGLEPPEGTPTAEGDGITLGSCSRGNEGAFFKCRPDVIDHEQAFRDVNNGSSTPFQRAMPLGYELSVRTGGLFCPLMRTASVSAYVDHDGDYTDGGDCSAGSASACCQEIHDGAPGTEGKTPCVYNNSIRLNTEYQIYAVEYLSKERQAARCAETIVTSNPYIQEEPLKVCMDGGCQLNF